MNMNNTITNITDSLKIIINSILADKTFLVLFFIIFIIFIVITHFTYTKFIKPNINVNHKLNKEFIKKVSENDNDVLVILFKTEWCPHCKSAMTEWLKFKDYITKINNTNDYQVKLSIVDCDAKPTLAEKYEIEGYPTIKLIYKGVTYNYDAKPNKDNLIQFLESSIE